MTLKIYAVGQGQTTRELAAMNHINSIIKEPPSAKVHGGSAYVRTLLDHFEISSPKSLRSNVCLIFKPLGLSMADTRKLLFDGRFPLDVVKAIVYHVLGALDFLHRVANTVHGGEFTLYRLLKTYGR